LFIKFVKHMRPFLHPFFTDKGRAEECLKQLEAVATGEGLPVSELERRFVRWAGRMTMDRERRHRHLHKLQQPAVVDRLAQAVNLNLNFYNNN
jgi:hypothetical protein